MHVLLRWHLQSQRFSKFQTICHQLKPFKTSLLTWVRPWRSIVSLFHFIRYKSTKRVEKLLACYCKQMTILLEVYILVLLVVYICSTVCCKLHIYIFLIKTFHQGRMQSILAKLHSKSSLKEEESYKLRPAIMISQPLDVCCCKDVEDEQHFLLTWPAYSDITVQHRC